MDLVMLNGMPGIVTFNPKGVQEAAALEIAGGRIEAMYVVRNPEKLKVVAASYEAPKPRPIDA
jgi:RNA polymerase sigma-70 factor (ECF subfamily)